MEPVILDLTAIDLAIVVAVAVVLPASLGRAGWWRIAAGAVALSCALGTGTGPAVVVALVWPAVALVLLADAIRDVARARNPSGSSATEVLGLANALVAATWFTLSRAEVHPLGIGDPIVELTAVHFTWAGVGALHLADRARRAARGPADGRLGAAALALTAGAPTLIATGFVTGAALAQIGGAVAMSMGVFCTATCHLIEASRTGSTPATRLLLAVSGLAVWAPMVLAVAWAAGQHLDVPALSIPDMVRTHGAANAIGFVGAGLLARRAANSGRGARPLEQDGPSRNGRIGEVLTWS